MNTSRLTPVYHKIDDDGSGYMLEDKDLRLVLVFAHEKHPDRYLLYALYGVYKGEGVVSHNPNVSTVKEITKEEYEKAKEHYEKTNQEVSQAKESMENR